MELFDEKVTKHSSKCLCFSLRNKNIKQPQWENTEFKLIHKGMRLRKVRIQNFKCFENEEVSFPEQFTVVIGNNASGKSALLDALSIVAGSYLQGLDGAQSRGLKRGEIRRVYDSPNSVQKQFPVVLEALDSTIDGQSANGSRKKENKSSSLTLTYAQSNAYQIGKRHTIQLQESGNEVILPLIAYHGTGRLWTEKRKYKANKRQKKAGEGKMPYMVRGERTDGYFAALDAKSSKELFLSWFKTFEDNALKFGQDKTLYNALTETLGRAVPQWSQIHYSWFDDDMMGYFTNAEKESEWRPLSQLSDGYRTFISLVADLAWRCIQLNPHLESRVVLDTPGLVLIDELEMHLHPKWQRTVVQSLKDAFPRVQFVVTTHSPLTVQSLKKSEVVLLNYGKVMAISGEKDFRRWRLEQVLSSVLFDVSGMRGEAITELEQRKGEILAIPVDEQTERDRHELARIEEQLGNLPIALDEEERAYREQLKKAAEKIIKEAGL